MNRENILGYVILGFILLIMIKCYYDNDFFQLTCIVSDVNGALRVLKKRMMKDGFFQDLRERSHFTSKGEKKRKAKAAGRRRWLKKVEKRKLELGY